MSRLSVKQERRHLVAVSSILGAIASGESVPHTTIIGRYGLRHMDVYKAVSELENEGRIGIDEIASELYYSRRQ